MTRTKLFGFAAALCFAGLGQTVAQTETETAQPVTIATAVAEDKGLSDAQRTELRREKFDLGRGGLGIQGYDPVAYFPEAGGKPTKGSKKITHEHDGVTYRFANESNRAAFVENPERFEPAFGGWCAYAMSQNDYTSVNPKRYLIQNDRLLLFYNGLFGDTYKNWHDEGPAKLEPLADRFWTGEVTKQAEQIKG